MSKVITSLRFVNLYDNSVNDYQIKIIFALDDFHFLIFLDLIWTKEMQFFQYDLYERIIRSGHITSR